MVVCISVELVVISPLSFFIASIWLFYFLFISLASGLSILLIFSKNQLLDSLIFFWSIFCVFISFSSVLILVISYLLPAFEFVWSCFSSSFNCDDRVSILDLFLLVIWAFSAIIFPLTLLQLYSRDSGTLCLCSHWFQITSLFLPLFHYLPSSHSGAGCSVF